MSAAEGYTPRGASQAAKESAAGRTLRGVPRPPRPPARPAPVAPTAEAADTAPTPTQQLEPLRSLVPDTARTTELDDDELIGFTRGNLRHIRLYLSGTAADFLDEVAHRHRYPRGVVLMEAVRRHYQEIRDLYRLAPAEDPGPFGPARVVQRRRLDVESPRYVPASVTESEARGLSLMARETGLSVSAIVTESLERVKHSIDTTGGEFPGALP